MTSAISIDHKSKGRSVHFSKLLVESNRLVGVVRRNGKKYVKVRTQKLADSVTSLEIQSRIYDGPIVPLQNLKDVRFMRDNVILINGAFMASKKLESIKLPKNALFCAATFAYCYSLKSANIPQRMDIIPMSAFCENVNLRTLEIEGNISIMEDYCLSGCWNLDFQIPNTVQVIGNQVMVGLANQKLTIPQSCTTVGSMAFKNMKNLRHVIIENPKTEIPSDAFLACDNIETVQIANKKYAVKHHNHCSYIVMSDPERVHGINVIRVVSHIGHHATPDQYLYFAWAGNISCCLPDRNAAISNVRRNVMGNNYIQHMKNAPEQRLNASLQELYCTNLFKDIFPQDMKHPVSRYDCDKCMQLYPAIYKECIGRHFTRTK